MTEMPVEELRRLPAQAERGVADFLDLAAAWADRQLPRDASRVTAALARALLLPAPDARVISVVASGRSGPRAAG